MEYDTFYNLSLGVCMLNDLFYMLIAFVLSALFSMAGSGSGMALIPILNFLGVDFTIARAVGLFAGATTTITATVMNVFRKSVDVKLLLPLALMMLLFAPFGAYCSQFIDQEILKFFFMLLLFYSATMMFFGKQKTLIHYTTRWILYFVGAVVGFISGLLGVGGGNILIPLLTFLGYESKKIAVIVSFVVPFSALSSFATYASYLQLDWLMLLCVGAGAIMGGYTGNYMMHFKLSPSTIRKIMALILYLLALKILWHFI